ncbi:MAG: hypothetical protein IKJ80_05380 [Clostridia bacterium]|nr:hypothetical protein [Clostridia bacterium]
MKLYLSVIGIAMAIVAAINLIFETAPWYYVISAVIWCTVLQFALDGLIAILIRVTPDRYFDVDNPYFAVSEKSQALYKRLQVRRWKDKVWELGGLGGFSKKSLKEPTNPKYIEKFIIECNKGVVTHRLSYPIGFLAMMTVDGLCAVTIALPIAVVNVFLNVLPTLVLRYNTPLLQRLLARMNKKCPAAKTAAEA